ncbi:hypothetical protein M569_02834, partial [Genlisea aurea]
LLRGRICRRRLLEIHGRVFRMDVQEDDLVATRLIGHYPAKPALGVFRSLRNPNIFPYNAIIRVLAEGGGGLSGEALTIFKELKFSDAAAPNELTFSFVLKAVSAGEEEEEEEEAVLPQVHSHVLKSDYLRDSFLCYGLISAYAAARDIQSARQVFDEMSDRSLVSCWTVLIGGYARLGSAAGGLELFIAMLKENLRPDNETMVGVLSACSSLPVEDIREWAGRLERYKAASEGFGNDHVNTSLVCLYGKSGNTAASRASFDEIPENGGRRSVLVWNAMISSYLQNGCPSEAIGVFKSMMTAADPCVSPPNHVTMVSVLSACAEVGDSDLGVWVHGYVRSSGKRSLPSSNVNLATSLIEMYAKCGELDEARKVFGEMCDRDVIAFNAMITGLAINGKGIEALTLFSRMEEAHRLAPDSATFCGALSACSHSGLLRRGREVFGKMIRVSPPRVEHYGCYVDLLSRSGRLDEALGVATSMPFEPNSYTWGAILTGCVVHGRLEIAESVASMLVDVDPDNSGGYVLLSNTFASDRKWRRVAELRRAMRETGVRKEAGRSWISIDGAVHEFIAGSATNADADKVIESL